MRPDKSIAGVLRVTTAMKRIVRQLTLVLFASVGVLLLDADDAVVRRELEAKYQKVVRAWKSKDVDAVNAAQKSIFMPDRKWEPLPRGAADYFASVVAFEEVTVKIEKLTVAGNEAVAIVSKKQVDTEIDKSGKYGPNNATHKITRTTTVKDTWIKTPDGWKQKSQVKLIPTKLVVDGKQFEP